VHPAILRARGIRPSARYEGRPSVRTVLRAVRPSARYWGPFVRPHALHASVGPTVQHPPSQHRPSQHPHVQHPISAVSTSTGSTSNNLYLVNGIAATA
jgi:hypothetical protein